MDRTAVKTEVDGHRLIFHPRRVVDWLENRTVYPIYMELGLTNRCNHRCVFCGLDWVERGRVEIDGGVLESAIRDLARCGVKSVMFAGEGEPLLHPSACEFIRFAKESGLDVSLNTNGALLTEAIARRCLPFLSWIRISLDAGTAGTYSTVQEALDSLGATPTNTLLTAAATNTLAGTAWQTLTVTNAVTLLWTNVTPDTYTLVLDCGTNSVTWPTNWTWLLGSAPDGTNIVVSWFPKPSNGWYAIGGAVQ